MRQEIYDLVSEIKPFDSLEVEHIQDTLSWINSGAPLFRIKKPDIPPKHLVSYFVPFDMKKRSIMLIDHVTSGLWLPNGGHVDLDEHPKDTVMREAKEELDLEARFNEKFGPKPIFLTSTMTVEAHNHTDVSLWYIIEGYVNKNYSYDPREMRGYKWLTFDEILRTDIRQLDPHMHRFIRKLNTNVR